MKRLSTGLALAVLLTLTTQPVSAAPETPDVAAKAAQKEQRVVKRLTQRFEADEFWHFDDKGRIKGEDGDGVFVFIQQRPCGKGKWVNRIRETTTSHGVFDFHDYYKASVKKKYKVKEYKPKLPNSVQFGFFIPATDTHKAYRVADTYCYG